MGYLIGSIYERGNCPSFLDNHIPALQVRYQRQHKRQDGWGQALLDCYGKVCPKTMADHFVRKLSVPVLILSDSL